ncbi:hypothetical protein EV359DRAFT_69025 [Lentinula novae-zelandiae]|nr:hypothetical protein EV359DRAFT_69025 [Lentinula novae-zelandiae]
MTTAATHPEGRGVKVSRGIGQEKAPSSVPDVGTGGDDRSGCISPFGLDHGRGEERFAGQAGDHVLKPGPGMDPGMDRTEVQTNVIHQQRGPNGAVPLQSPLYPLEWGQVSRSIEGKEGGNPKGRLSPEGESSRGLGPCARPGEQRWKPLTPGEEKSIGGWLVEVGPCHAEPFLIGRGMVLGHGQVEVPRTVIGPTNRRGWRRTRQEVSWGESPGSAPGGADRIPWAQGFLTWRPGNDPGWLHKGL